MLPRVQSRISDHLGARAQYIWTRQFGQHYASQSLTNAADAQQKIAFRLKVAIIVDRQCDGFVDRSELAREVRDRRIGQGLSLRVDNAAVLAILPFRETRDDARSDRLELSQPTVGLGRARLATRPALTGSFESAKTIGMTDVARFAAMIPVPAVTMTSTFRW